MILHTYRSQLIGLFAWGRRDVILIVCHTTLIVDLDALFINVCTYFHAFFRTHLSDIHLNCFNLKERKEGKGEEWDRRDK
jgi:hypothetical protein